jgi:outer membrane immunogenic protein
MQRFIRSGLAFALTVAAGAASAADLPRRAQMPAKAPELAAPLYNWSGFYLGINGGGAWGTSRWDAPAAGVTTGSFDISGGLVGGTAGFNMQTGQII